MRNRIFLFLYPQLGHLTSNLYLLDKLCKEKYEVICFGDIKFSPYLKHLNIKFVSYSYKSFSFDDKEIHKPSKAFNHCHSFYLADFNIENVEWNTLISEHILISSSKWIEENFMKIKPNLILYDTFAKWGQVLADKYNIPSIEINSATDLDVSNRLYKFFYNDVVLQEITEDLKRGYCSQKIVDEYFLPVDEYINFIKKLNSRTSKLIQSLCLNRKVDSTESFTYLSQSFLDIIDEKNTKPCGYLMENVNHQNKDGLFVTRGTSYTEYENRILNNILLSIGESFKTRAVTYNNTKLYAKKYSNNIKLYSFVNQIDMLSKSSIMISHGGITGVREAIMCETPIIVYPSNFHNYQVGVAVEQLGIGKMLKRRELSHKTSKEVIESIEEMIQDKRFHQNIVAIKRELITEFKEDKIMKYVKKKGK